MNIKQSVRNHPRRVGVCCLALVMVTLIIIVIILNVSSGLDDHTESCDMDHMTPLSQLGSLLASTQCPVLVLRNVALSEENTLALVTAMRARVQEVTLHYGVTLDPDVLATYDGLGLCNKLVVWGDTRRRYGDRIKRWAADRGWRVTRDYEGWLVMKKI